MDMRTRKRRLLSRFYLRPVRVVTGRRIRVGLYAFCKLARKSYDWPRSKK